MKNSKQVNGSNSATHADAVSRKEWVIWLTGLSSAGKTTIGRELLARLLDMKKRAVMLDGDELRQTLCRDLGFTRSDRDENVRRIGHMADELASQGTIVIVAAIAPYRAAREEVREKIGRFLEIYVSTPLEVCELRDVKGLYRRSRLGEMKGLTGIDDPYEPPLNPALACDTVAESLHESVEKILLRLNLHE